MLKSLRGKMFLRVDFEMLQTKDDLIMTQCVEGEYIYYMYAKITICFAIYHIRFGNTKNEREVNLDVDNCLCSR